MSSAVFVDNEPPQEPWHQGARFQVFIHMPLLEDYSAARRNLDAAIANPASIVPIRRRYHWRYGLVDGSPPEARSTFPARLPKPPQEPAGREQAQFHDRLHQARGDLNGDFGGWSIGDRDRPDDDEERLDRRREHCGSGGWRDCDDARDDSNNAGCRARQDDNNHRDRHDGGRGGRDTRDGRHGSNGQTVHRDTHHGRHGQIVGRDRQEEEALRRRLLARRRGRNTCKEQDFTWPNGGDNDGDDYDHPGHGDKYGDDFWGLDGAVRRERSRTPPRRNYTTRAGMQHGAGVLRAIFNNTLLAYDKGQVHRSPHAIPGMLGDHDASGGAQLTTKLTMLLDMMSDGHDRANDNGYGDGVDDAGDGTGTKGIHNVGEEAWSEPVAVSTVFSRLRNALRLPRGPATSPPAIQDVAVALDAMVMSLEDLCVQDKAKMTNYEVEEAQDAHAKVPQGDGLASTEADGTAPQLPVPNDAPAPELAGSDVNSGHAADTSIDNDFVRRSSRLSKKPTMHAEERAQRNLCRKLGISSDAMTPIEEVMRQFVRTFQGPLPGAIVAAMATIFELETEGAELLDDALINYAGAPGTELQTIDA